jgi:hypothetical protein
LASKLVVLDLATASILPKKPANSDCLERMLCVRRQLAGADNSTTLTYNRLQMEAGRLPSQIISTDGDGESTEGEGPTF